MIMQHMWKKLNCKPKEWRRIFKALHAMEYLAKNGAPRCIQELKDDLFKIRALQDFSFSENGVDRGQGGKFSHIKRYKIKISSLKEEECSTLPLYID